MAIRILTTGGTIDKVYFDAKSTYSVGPPQIEDILSNVGVAATYEIQTLMSKDSLDLTDEDREMIRDVALAALEKQILITHGTDTMVQTGMALLDIPDKTIVLVGSLSPARFKGSDAEFNLGFALAATQTLPPGVYIAMNGRFFDVRRVRKNADANRFEDVG